jgi:predicted DNA-binding transcriptional regulator YafY
MRRADRLFQIIQIMRRSHLVITAESIASELEVTKRTVYRDIAHLIGQRVPIRGEAGLGYVLDGSFDMPPLMLTPDEIEAAVLGAQWVSGRGDPVLASAAGDLAGYSRLFRCRAHAGRMVNCVRAFTTSAPTALRVPFFSMNATTAAQPNLRPDGGNNWPNDHRAGPVIWATSE